MTTDTRRDQIAAALAGWGTRRSREAQLNAIMPILRAAVEQARAETAEAIAQAVERDGNMPGTAAAIRRRFAPADIALDTEGDDGEVFGPPLDWEKGIDP